MCAWQNNYENLHENLNHAALEIDAHGGGRANQFNHIESATHRIGAVSANVAVAVLAVSDARVVSRREVWHLGALGAAVPARARRLVWARNVYSGQRRL